MFFTPYETAPAELALFDWCPYSVMIGYDFTFFYLFSFFLGFSSFQILEPALTQTLADGFEAFVYSVTVCGGLTQRILSDFAMVFVINASSVYFKWFEIFLLFCGLYGYEPYRSLPALPWSKG